MYINAMGLHFSVYSTKSVCASEGIDRLLKPRTLQGKKKWCAPTIACIDYYYLLLIWTLSAI